MTIDEVARRYLEELHLLPGVAMPGSASPSGSGTATRDAYRGAMIGTAIGDALGRPAEGSRSVHPESSREHFSDFQRWRGWSGGPEGTITDDTQMTMCVAESLVATGATLDPADLARRFADWLDYGRGKGRTCVTACVDLKSGIPWWEAGVRRSAGNGAAMRAAPIGLAHPDDLDALRLDAALSAVITHADQMAVVSAVAHAWLIARLSAIPAGTIDPARLIDDLCGAIGDLEDAGAKEREWQQRGRTADPVRLVERIAEIPDKLSLSRQEAADYFYCGAFVLESLPMAIWHFLAAPEDPEQVIVNGVLGGFDADTVASMAGAYVGAYLGELSFPERWRTGNLEYAADIRRLADELFDLTHPSRGSS